MRRFALRIASMLVLAFGIATSAVGQESAQTILHLLDYVGADYGGAVENGRVKSADEYKEMVEFGKQALDGLKELPLNQARDSLAKEAERLTRLIADKAPDDSVPD